MTESPNPVDQSDAVALVAFLRSCLDEDERIARSASPAPWSADDSHCLVSAQGRGERLDGVVVASVGAYNKSLPSDADRGHILRHDPVRVLADIESKRRILERWDAAYPMSLEGWPAGCVDSRVPDDVAADEAAFSALTEVVKDLAAPYRDRLGWRESWEPT